MDYDFAQMYYGYLHLVYVCIMVGIYDYYIRNMNGIMEVTM